MNKGKIVRLYIAAIAFLCILSAGNTPTREFHQFFFVILTMAAFSLFFKNIWATLFMVWTLMLFIYTKFNFGGIYVTNIFYGCLIYCITKMVFKKKDVSFYLDIILWVLVANLFYMILQMVGFDFIYGGRESFASPIFNTFHRRAPIGFMGNTSITAVFIALCVPILLARATKAGYICASLLLIPLIALHSSSAYLAAGAGTLFVLWFRLRKQVWAIVLVGLILFGGLYAWKVDMPGTERFSAWKLMLKDAMRQPVTGLGLDSLRNFTKKNPIRYVQKLENVSATEKKIDFWDNPHNLYISIFFEFGLVGLILLGGYLRQIGIWFARASKVPNTLALAGFLIVFFVASMGSFPIFLARLAVIIIPVFALLEVQIS